MSLIVDIRKRFSAFELNVSFEAGNETLGLLGASGCGKSLTLRCVAGLEKPDEGRIVVAGKVFFDSKRRINLSPQQRKTALLFQSYMLFPNLTVAQNIAAGLPRGMSKDEAHVIVSEQLERFGLAGFGKRYPIRLSGGQQQRVALARMLVAKPAILMLDEPFSALDSHLKASLEFDLLDLFDSFEGTIVYVSHDIDEAFRFCDRIAVIDRGSLREIATTEQIRDHPTSWATMKVSGVKNISHARKVGAHQVEALDWGITLTTEAVVPNDVAYLGVRATFIQPASPGAANPIAATVLRAIDSRFERTVLLRTSEGAAQPLHWRFSRVSASPAGGSGGSDNSGDAGGEAPSPHLATRGDTVSIEIPPSQIYLVRS